MRGRTCEANCSVLCPQRVVAEALCREIGPVRARAAELQARPRLLRDVLRDGAARARARADLTWQDVARLVGLRAHTDPVAPRLHALRPPAAAEPGASAAAEPHAPRRRAL